MIIIKAKNKLFEDITYEYHNGYYYMYANDAWKLINNDIVAIEASCDVVEFDNDCFLIMNKPHPFDLQKQNIKGEPIVLADSNEWIIPTIADVRYRFTLKKQDGQFVQTMEVCDPLFNLLIDYADKIKCGVDYADLIGLIAEVMGRNYYVSKNIILALGLIDTDNIEKIIMTIYRYDELRSADERFFRKSNNGDETKSNSG